MSHFGLQMTPLYDVVCSLLVKPFETWREVDQVDVVNGGRPQVVINVNKRKSTADDPCGKFHKFKKTWYYTYEWLCGSTYLQSLHCWPCLLFAKESDRWVCNRYVDGSEIASFDKHELEEEHLRCCRKLAKFAKLKSRRAEKCVARDLLTKIATNALISEEEIRLNRQCAQFAIDAIMFMVKNQVLLSEVSEDSPSSHSELVHLLMSQSSDEELKAHFRKMKGRINPILSTSIQTGIVESLSECIQDYIRGAIKESKFFVVRIDDGLFESTDCSLFLRCFNSRAELKEYFIGFYSLGTDKTSLSLFRIIDTILDNYQYKSKLVGICYDITCVKFNYLKDLRVGLKFMAQQAVHVNLFGHCLDYLLERCLNSIPACRIFFSNLNAMLSLVQTLMKKSYQSNAKIWREVCNLQNTCCSKIKLLSAMLDDWAGLKLLLQEVLQEPTASEEVICLASNMLDKLMDFDFIFLVVFFHHLFQLTDNLHLVLRGHALDSKFCHAKIKDACVTIYRQRNESFYNYMHGTANRTMSRYCNQESLPSINTQKNYKPLYYEVLDNVIMELHTRFENTDQYVFLELGDSSQFEMHGTLTQFTKERVQILVQFFPDLFPDKDTLQNAVLKMNKNRRFWKLPLMRIIQLIYEFNDRNYDEALKLMCLIALLIPTIKYFPCLHKYSSYLKNAEPEQRPHLARILMNKEILTSLSTRYFFKDDVLNKLSVKYDAIKLSHMIKGLQKDAKQDDKFSSDAGPSVDVESDTNLLLTAAASDMVVELDPTTFVPSDSEEPDPSDLCEAGPSSRVEPDSSMMEDEHLAMTCEVYPVKTEPDSPSMDIRIKEEPEDTFKQDILSATVERELYHFTKDTPPAISDEDSLFQPPVLIKEEPVSSEEDL